MPKSPASGLSLRRRSSFARLRPRASPPRKTRLAATALSFALCFAYLLLLPFHAWGLAALIAVGTLVLTSVGQTGDVGVAGITTAAVMIIAALSPDHPWHQPLIGAVATAIGISIGLGTSWLVNGKLVGGLWRQALGGRDGGVPLSRP